MVALTTGSFITVPGTLGEPYSLSLPMSHAYLKAVPTSLDILDPYDDHRRVVPWEPYPRDLRRPNASGSKHEIVVDTLFEVRGVILRYGQLVARLLALPSPFAPPGTEPKVLADRCVAYAMIFHAGKPPVEQCQGLRDEMLRQFMDLNDPRKHRRIPSC